VSNAAKEAKELVDAAVRQGNWGLIIVRRSTMKTFIRVVALLSLGIVAGCATNSTTAGTQAAATAEPLIVIAQQFSSLRQACDDELNREKQGIGNDLPSLQHAATLAVATYDHCAQQLTAIAMPASVQADQKALVTEFDKFSNLWHQVATASYGELQSLLGVVQSEEAAQHAPLVALERDLGLPETTPRV
jgi:hypothetical protein